MDDQKNSAKELKRQIWEPAGVVSMSDAKVTQGIDYGVKPKDTEKGGRLTLEVEDVFHNRGIMENLEGKNNYK